MPPARYPGQRSYAPRALPAPVRAEAEHLPVLGDDRAKMPDSQETLGSFFDESIPSN
ncbi:hypothetical protein PN456_07430 [Nodularia spumigena CS-586/05]|uniref:hypothetical protein n=1 Tax=Nodularia spumigena TaxID=70799 RepID=UPI001914CF71|nr:hypothetical protein [Nodularia spumigena]MDB9343480.1 hypothetical protein [Nodularia spumigena CS-588/06]MDB9368788.1 hypothetical protein [Nodularia spumigena CS-586/05]